MLTAPRPVAICFILLGGVAGCLCGQTDPALTPGSVYYLKERVAVTTKFGVTGLIPGTGVRVISEHGNTFRVTNGTNTFDLSKDKLTANINDARLAAQSYYATEQASAQAFNAEVVRTQQERKRALDQQIAAAAQQRQRQMQQEQIAAQQEQRQLEAQQKQEAKIAGQRQAREQQKKKRRTTGDAWSSWDSWSSYTPGGGYEIGSRSGNAKAGSYHVEHRDGQFNNTASARTDNVTDASWGPAPKRNKAKKRETPSP